MSKIIENSKFKKVMLYKIGLNPNPNIFIRIRKFTAYRYPNKTCTQTYVIVLLYEDEVRLSNCS